MKRKLMLAGIASCLALSPAKAESPFEIRDVQLTQNSFSTEVQVELFARYGSGRLMFLRLRCEVRDANGKTLGMLVKDLSSGLPYRPLNLQVASFHRPRMRTDRIDDADHASCRFATSDDALPIVGPDDVVAELLSVWEVHVINRSPYQIARVAFKCRGPNGTTTYEQGVLGWSPFYTSPRQALPHKADQCSVTAVTVAATPNLGN